jgi:hypothetical protein
MKYLTAESRIVRMTQKIQKTVSIEYTFKVDDVLYNTWFNFASTPLFYELVITCTLMIIRQHPKCFICALEALPSFSTILWPSIKVIKAKKKAPAQDERKKTKMMKQTCYSASSKSAIQPKKEQKE